MMLGSNSWDLYFFFWEEAIFSPFSTNRRLFTVLFITACMCVCVYARYNLVLLSYFCVLKKTGGQIQSGRMVRLKLYPPLPPRHGGVLPKKKKSSFVGAHVCFRHHDFFFRPVDMEASRLGGSRCSVGKHAALWRLLGPCGGVHLRRICPSFRLLPPSSAQCAAVAWDGLPNRECVGSFLGRPGHRNTRVNNDPGVFLYVAFFFLGCVVVSARQACAISAQDVPLFYLFSGVAYVSHCGWGFSVIPILFLNYISQFLRLLIVANSCWWKYA